MSKYWLGWSIGIFVALLASAAPGYAGRRSKKEEVKPSENAGRRGQYTVASKTVEGYFYHVYVPKSYSEDNPAGLHLFFSGQGGCADNSNFGQFAKHFCEPYNLIGIHPKYPDGDNMKNTAGKAQVAREAIAQVIADYKVVPGRGHIGCFSGGGLPCEEFYNEHAKKERQDEEFPFTHAGLYGSNWRKSAVGNLPMTFCVGLGEKEWNMAGLGDSQTGRVNDRIAVFLNDGTPDFFFNYTPGKGHSISNDDCAESARMYPRSNLAYAPFVYAPDFEERDFRKIVEKANELELDDAQKYLERLLGKDDLEAPIKEKAQKLKAQIDARVAALVKMANELMDNDPVLAEWYVPIFIDQIKRLDQGRELKKRFRDVSREKEYKKANDLFEEFAENFRTFWDGQGKLSPDKVELLEEIIEVVPESSSFGRMAREFMAFKRG